jgi:glycosyltransferase involved in cell wall biosynthesis
MKIIVVHNTYQQPGGEDIVFDQERRMLELAGHHVVVYSRSNHEIGNLNILGQIGMAKQTVWASDTRREFDKLLARERPDVVHIHNTFMLISPSIYTVCRDWGVPVVQTLHNFRLLCPNSNLFRDNHICEECVDDGLWRSIQYACYRDSRAATAAVVLMLSWHRHFKTWDKGVSRYIALTNFAREKFIAAGFPADKIVVKPNFLESDPGSRERAGDYAVFMGRLSPDKGVFTLLEAWEQLREQLPLQIIGDGIQREELEETARARGLNVTFRGHLSREESISTLKHARFLVMPSLGYETFGMVIVEAFACGIPALCSRLGAMQEIVRDQQTGLHFTPGDATDLAQKVEWAWNNPSEIEAMGREGRREYEERYTAEKNYEMLRQVYEGVLQSQGRPELAVDSAKAVSSALKNLGTARTDAKKSYGAEAAKNSTSPQIVV